MVISNAHTHMPSDLTQSTDRPKQMAIRRARDHNQQLTLSLLEQGRLDLVKAHDFL